jgi:tetratricopeptide (TPR) repeat protein
LGPDETVRRAELTVGLAFFRAIWQREGDAVLPLAEEAVALAREAGTPRILAKALYQMHFANAGLPPEGSIALADEMIELARGAGDTFSLVAGLRLRIWALVAAGDLPGFLRDLDEMAVLAERQRWRIDLAITDVQRAMLALLNGRFDQVEELAASGLAHAGNDPNYVQTHTTQLLLLRREQGRLAEFLPTVDSDYLQGPGVARRAVVALAYADVGRLDRAKELFHLAVQQSAKAGARLQRSPSLAALAELAVVLGEPEQVTRLHDLLVEQHGRMVTLATSVGCLGAADRFLGMLTATLERWDEAEGYFEAALALEERMESPPLMARTRYWYARMLLSRNRPGDLERGLDLLARARDSADELGMALLASQVRDVERASSGQP